MFVCIFFSILTIIRIDLREGSLQYTSFYNNERFEETFLTSYVVTIVQENDTIHSLFTTTLSPQPMTFTERLTLFYAFNKHLQKQPLTTGEQVRVPIRQHEIQCKK